MRGTVRLAPLEPGGKDEVYVLSEQEKQIGRSVFEKGRLSFPTPLSLTGEPAAMDVADLDGDKAPEILYVARAKAKWRKARRLLSSERSTRDHRGRFGPTSGAKSTRSHSPA